MAVLSLKSLLALAAGLSSVAAAPLRARGGDKPDLPYDENTTSYCSWWMDNDGSKTCEEVLDWNWIDIKTFYRWNPSVKSDCSGLQTGRSYCVEAFGEPTPPEEPEITTTKAAVTTTKTASTTTKAPTTTTAAAGNGVETPSPVHLGLVANCNKFELVGSGDTCDVISRRNGVRSADIIAWNGLNAGCTNIWAETYACVGIIGGSTVTQAPTTTTSPAGNGIQTPEPVHNGIVANCNKFYLVKSGDTCAAIAQSYGVRTADVVTWNGLNSGCTNLWQDTYACVGMVGSSAVTTKAPTTTSPTGNGVQTPAPVHLGIVANCNKFYLVKGGDTCAVIAQTHGVRTADVVSWNGLNSGCTNLWGDTYACVGVVGGTTPPTTTKPSNGVATPTPIQPGMVGNCNKFHDIKVGTTCQAIADYNKFPIADFYKWNPGVNAACTNLQLGAYACTGVIGGTSTPPTTTKPSNGVATPTPIQPGMVGNCNRFHDIKVGTTCQAIADYNKFPIADFYKWNPGVNSACTNLQLGAYACTGVIGGSTTPTTPTNPGNGVTTPVPIQPGMVSNCNKFHDVKSTTTCQGIADYNKISLSDFYKWNPQVNSGCTNLQMGAYACTGVIGGSTTPPTTPTNPGNGVTTPLPVQPGMVSNCNKFHDIKVGTTCQGIADYNKISLSDFYKWNPQVNSGCTNLNLGAYACTGVIGGGSSSPSPVTTPTPTQAGMVQGCKAFATVRPTTTCQGILDWNKITLANFVKWNPAVRSDCSNLWSGTWACIAGP